jgi:protein gp37
MIVDAGRRCSPRGKLSLEPYPQLGLVRGIFCFWREKMGERTEIQWCDSTVNPTNGCDGCEVLPVCYARPITELWGSGGLRGPAIGINGIKLTPQQARNFTELSLAPGRMKIAAGWKDLTGTRREQHKEKVRSPWLDGMPRLIFVSDMSDALSAAFSFEYLREEIIDTVRSAKGLRHCWLWLTKRPGRMAEFAKWLKADGIDWPVNLWVGTSLTTQASLSRAKQLLEVGDEKTRHFLSVEPQRESIDLGDLLPKFDLIIQGGESRQRPEAGKEPPVPFDFDGMWADDLRDKCKAANVPYFLKQFGAKPTFQGKPYSFKDPHGGDWSEWPERFRVREFPQPVGCGGTIRWAETPLAGSVGDGCETWNGQSFLTDAEKEQLTKSHAAQGKRPEAKPPSVLVYPKDNGKDPKMVAAGKKAWETRRRQDALNAAVAAEVAAEAKARLAVKSVPQAAPVNAKRATLGNIYRPWISANGRKIFASSYGLAAFCIPVNVGDLKP